MCFVWVVRCILISNDIQDHRNLHRGECLGPNEPLDRPAHSNGYGIESLRNIDKILSSL